MDYKIEQFPQEEKPIKVLTEQPTIHPSAKISNSILGSWSDIGPGVSITDTSVGDYTYFAGDASVIYSEIGKFCSIASHVRLNPGNHPTWRVTQHHMTYRRKQYGFGPEDDQDFFQWRAENKVRLGHDVWLGHGVLVMAGVSIGTGCSVGSGAVVTRDLPPYSIAVGVPAKIIKYRFDFDTIQKIMDSKWWDWDRETLEKNFSSLLNPSDFFAENFLQK